MALLPSIDVSKTIVLQADIGWITGHSYCVYGELRWSITVLFSSELTHCCCHLNQALSLMVRRQFFLQALQFILTMAVTGMLCNVTSMYRHFTRLHIFMLLMVIYYPLPPHNIIARCTQFYTAPTAIRMLMRYGPDVISTYDLSSLRVLGTVGEPINTEAWRWYYEHVGHSNKTIVDTWWQTETGGHVLTALPGITPLKVRDDDVIYFTISDDLLLLSVE